jgi:transposase-like protein
MRYRLSYAEMSEWLAERGVLVDQSTIYRGCSASCRCSAKWLGNIAIQWL